MNILLTSAGRRTYLVKYFQKELAGEGMVYASNSIMTNTLHYADGFVITPEIYDPEYIPFLIGYCKEHDISVIISLFDIDLMILAKNKTLFLQEGIRVVVSDENVIDICNDKYKTYLFLKENHFNVPKTYLLKEKCLQEIAAGNLQYPIVIKPRWGMGSIGIYIAENEEELNVFDKKLKRDIFKTYLRFESKQDPDSAILYQEKINGDEYGLDVINDLQSNYVMTSPKRKLAMRAGETDIAEKIDSPELERTGKELSDKLKHIANLDVDCFISNGHVYVLELNSRFGGQYPFSYLAGINLPGQIIAWLKGENTDSRYFQFTPYVKASKELTIVSDSFPGDTLEKEHLSVEINSMSYERILAFLQKVDCDFLSPLSSRVNLEEYAGKILKTGTVFSLCENNNPVGFAACYCNDYKTWNGFIALFVIDRNVRGKGMGHILLGFVLRYMKEHGMKRVKLEVSTENAAAVKLYENAGFVFTDEIVPRINKKFMILSF